MLEAERQSLMRTMGVQILQPRFILSGAKPSNVFPQEVLLVNDTDTAALIPLPVVDEQPLSPVIAESAFVHPSALFKEENKTVVSLPIQNASSNKEPHSQTVIRCRYRLVRVGELLLLFDQATPEWQDAAMAKLFFADIYFALFNKKYEYWIDMQFDWPPLKNFPNANDKAVIQQSLTMFVEAQITQPPCKWVLLFGESSTKYLLDTPLPIGDTHFFAELPVLMLDSYQQYWLSPHKKVLLWQYLQVVKKSLVDNAAV